MIFLLTMKRIINTLIILALVVFFLYLFAKNLDIEKAKYYVIHTRLRFLFFIFLVYPFIYYFRSLRWRQIMGKEGERMKLIDVYSSNILGFAINYTIPARIGEFARAAILGKKTGVSTMFIFSTVLIERILDLGAMVFFAGIFYIFKGYAFKDMNPTESSMQFLLKGSVIAFISFVVLMLALFLIYLLKRKVVILWEKLCNKILPKKMRNGAIEIGDRFIEGLISLFENERKIAIFVNSLIIWFLISTGYWIALFDFGLKVSFVAIIPYIVALLIGASIPTPGMVGGFEALSQMALTGFYRMNKNIAAAATILMHLSLIMVTLMLSIPFLIREGKWVLDISKYKKMKEEIK